MEKVPSIYEIESSLLWNEMTDLIVLDEEKVYDDKNEGSSRTCCEEREKNGMRNAAIVTLFKRIIMRLCFWRKNISYAVFVS